MKGPRDFDLAQVDVILRRANTRKPVEDNEVVAHVDESAAVDAFAARLAAAVDQGREDFRARRDEEDRLAELRREVEAAAR